MSSHKVPALAPGLVTDASSTCVATSSYDPSLLSSACFLTSEVCHLDPHIFAGVRCTLPLVTKRCAARRRQAQAAHADVIRQGDGRNLRRAVHCKVPQRVRWNVVVLGHGMQVNLD